MLLRTGWIIVRLAISCPLALALVGWLVVQPLQAAEVLDVRVGRHPDRTRLVFDLGSPVRYGYRYGEAFEITVALEGGAPGGPEVTETAGLVAAVRRSDPEGRRYVIKLRDAARVDRIFYLAPSGKGPYRLVIDLVKTPRAEWSALVASTTPAEPEPSKPAPATQTPATEPAVLPESVPETEAQPETEASAEPESETKTVPPETPVALTPKSDLFDGLSISGSIQAEGRVFTQDSREPGPSNQTASVALTPRVDYTWNGGRQIISFAPFARIDAQDTNRTHFDIRELKWVGAFDRFEVRLGIDTVFWGVTESVHLVDIINQDDMLEDIDAEDKLGQPMAVVSYDSPAGLFSFYAMTYHRQRHFAGAYGRPRGPLLIDTSQTQYESKDGRWHFDWAARWSQVFGPVDVAVSHFHGTSRDPLFVAGVNSGGQPVLVPRYNIIDQTSLEFQATVDALLLKFEGYHRWQPGRNYFAAAGGFEYTFFNAIGSSDIGVLSEYLWDQRGRQQTDNPFEDDLFAGLRWTANDVAGTTILAGSIFDLHTQARFVNIEASRRFGNNWTLSLDARLLLTVPVTDPLFVYSDDDFIQLRLERHF